MSVNEQDLYNDEDTIMSKTDIDHENEAEAIHKYTFPHVCLRT